MKENNWFNRIFFKDTLLREKNKYRKLKIMLSEYPELMDKVINAKNLLNIYTLHLKLWASGFRNKNLAPCEWGMFRTKDISTMTPDQVFIGGVFGLNTHNIPSWDACDKNEIYGPNGFGLQKDAKVYDIIVDLYRNVLKCNLESIKEDAEEFTTEYENLNIKDEYSI